jgi:two-component system, OmpR family, sensor histidine kinase ArlS
MLLKVINYIFKIIKSAKISLKLTIVYAVMFSLVLLILNASVLYGIKYYLYSQANKQIEDVKIIVLNKVKPQNENVELSGKEIVADVTSKQNVFIRILNGDGKVLNTSDGFNYNIKVEEPFDEVLDSKEDDQRLVYKNLKIKTKEHGAIYIQIVKNMDNEYDFMKILFGLMAIADLIGSIVSIILGYTISKKMLRPIDQITKAADNISINNLKERIDIIGPDDELKRLGNTFNKMIDRLQEAFDRQILLRLSKGMQTL